MPDINLLEGSLSPPNETPTRKRITQVDIVPRSIKPRHLDNGMFAVRFGLAEDLPTDGNEVGAYFAIDTSTLYCWDGSIWKSVVLT